MSSYMHIVGKRKRRAAFLFLRIWASFCAKPQFCIASLSKRYLQISQFYIWQASDLCTIYPLKNNKRLWNKIRGSNTIWIWHNKNISFDILTNIKHTTNLISIYFKVMWMLTCVCWHLNVENIDIKFGATRNMHF